MKNQHLQSLVGICICSFMVLGLSGCGKQTSPTPSAQTTPVVMTNTIITEGHLIPKTSTWLSFQTAGRVEEILLSEGESITRGQALIKLEGSDRAESELKAAQSALFLAQQNLNDAKNSDAMKGAAELELATAQRDYNRKLYNYNNRLTPQGSQEQIDLYDARVTIAQKKVDDLQEDLDGMAETSDDDVLKAQVIANLNLAKMELDDIKDNYEYYRDQPDEIDIDRIQAELDIAAARLEDAQRDYDRLKDGPTKESLASLQMAADQAQANADNAQWAYDQLVLRAPYDGVFIQCELSVGEFVTIGQKVALVADFSEWKVETDDLDEMEITQIDTTQPVTITADAIPDKVYSGTIERISDFYTDDNGDILYTATVKLDEMDELLRWGMTVQLEFQK